MFSQKQIQEFKEAFGIIDVDKDGIITANDLKAAFVNIGRPITDAEANNLVGEAPGPINFTQMVTLFAEKMAGGESEIKQNSGFKTIKFELFSTLLLKVLTSICPLQMLKSC